MAWGTNKFTKKLLKPNAIANNELADFKSRVPDNEELVRSHFFSKKAILSNLGSSIKAQFLTFVNVVRSLLEMPHLLLADFISRVPDNEELVSKMFIHFWCLVHFLSIVKSYFKKWKVSTWGPRIVLIFGQRGITILTKLHKLTKSFLQNCYLLHD